MVEILQPEENPDNKETTKQQFELTHWQHIHKTTAVWLVQFLVSYIKYRSATWCTALVNKYNTNI